MYVPHRSTVGRQSYDLILMETSVNKTLNLGRDYQFWLELRKVE